MNELLQLDSPKYLKRLARALNEESYTGNGFYAVFSGQASRCSSARLRGGVIEARQLSSSQWLSPDLNTFCDAYGRNIVASRRAR